MGSVASYKVHYGAAEHAGRKTRPLAYILYTRIGIAIPRVRYFANWTDQTIHHFYYKFGCLEIRPRFRVFSNLL